MLTRAVIVDRSNLVRVAFEIIITDCKADDWPMKRGCLFFKRISYIGSVEPNFLILCHEEHSVDPLGVVIDLKFLTVWIWIMLTV